MTGMESRGRGASRRPASGKPTPEEMEELERSPKFSAGFALMSLVPLLLAVYLLDRTGALRSGNLIGEGGVILLLMVAAAVSGLYFLRQELTRTLLFVLRETMRVTAARSPESAVTLSPRIADREIEDLASEIQRATMHLEEDLRGITMARVRLRVGIDRVTEALRASRETTDLFYFLAESARAAVGGSNAVVFAVDEDRAEFIARAASGEKADEWSELRLPLGEGVPGLAVSRQRPILLKDGTPTGSPIEAAPGATARALAVPLFRGDTVHGVLLVKDRTDGESFTDDDLAILANVSTFTVSGIDHRETKLRLEKGLEEVLLLLATAVEERDPYAKGHADRVARYAVEMAKVLRLDDDTIKMVRWGALLHDIGKIALGDSLLRKEGEYTDEEMEVVRQHPIIAEKMIRRAESLASACPMVRNHNERSDGSGYPDGLQGTEIPLTTHILIVANVFDAMTSDRSFRRALSVAEALERLRSFAGTKYDRRAVRALVSLDEKLLQVSSSTNEAGAVVRGQGTSSICIRG